MEFSCDVGDIHLVIESFKRGPSPRNPKKVSIFDIHITASKNGIDYKFVSSSHHISHKLKYLEKKLPLIVEAKELIEHVLHHIELDESESGPKWKM
ncbi:MAG: hypothetical protein HN576_01995 [Bacteriovoracaceae bacterium]|jgi:hypothetical protein|nr:hypothetical protein [Bacteriovoracaceae bacterium]